MLITQTQYLKNLYQISAAVLGFEPKYIHF